MASLDEASSGFAFRVQLMAKAITVIDDLLDRSGEG
jgi:hypothetical protein